MLSPKILVIAIALFLGSTTVTSAAGPAQFALLVGAGEYRHLPKSNQLGGTTNDVRLMRELLQSRFGFQAGDIQTLEGDSATGDGIRSAFERIIQALQELPDENKPAQVVFHFSGHGGQLPDQESEGRDETDGLDETLVPTDATMVGGEEDIRDDELNRLAHMICDQGQANLWIVLDCCHSGTGTRGVQKMGVPGLVGYRALRRDVKPTTTPMAPIVNTLPEGAVALYACRDHELAPEYFDGQLRYGLLTRFLTGVLQDSPEGSRISYTGLRDAIAARYRQDRQIGASAPVPQVEGNAKLLDAGVLGSGLIPSPRYWKVDAASSSPTLVAGAFHGIAKNAIYRLHESPEQIGNSMNEHTESETGFARTTKVEAATSSLEFVRWDGKKWQPSQWPKNLKRAYATLDSRGDNDFGLRVLVREVVESNRERTLNLESLSPPLQTIFVKNDGQQRTDDWLSLVEAPYEADVIVKIAGDQMAAFNAAGHCSWHADDQPHEGNALFGGWGPIDLRDDNAAEQSLHLLRRIAKARNLLRVAAHGDSGGIRPIRIGIELLAHDQNNSEAAPESWPNSTPGKLPGAYAMRSGDCYKYRIRNDGNEPVYVSVLHLNSDMGIEQVFPYQAGSEIEGADDTQIRPGESRIEGPFQCNGIGASSFGQRYTVVLATAKPNSFYMLVQPSLPKVRTFGEADSLSDILMSGAYFKTRSRRRPVKLFDNSWGSAIVQWVVQP
ncbi:Caspase domain protein [Novipirellula galeiformis]|uniref:Caspase domain protein n=1 Tax=Novipirellula galeiformis TaxID=2528004 RepID=A0A5C6CR04_9BACT|nr:caspase family protein [Novipirellula galeiformis]TWU25279.1 Caspase domain protein [Novipirellula galeiformis]